MKRLLLFFALCSSLGAWAQECPKVNGISHIEATPNTLTVYIHGTTDAMVEGATDFKWTNKAVGVVSYSSQGGNYVGSWAAGGQLSQNQVNGTETLYIGVPTHEIVDLAKCDCVNVTGSTYEFDENAYDEFYVGVGEVDHWTDNIPYYKSYNKVDETTVVSTSDRWANSVRYSVYYKNTGTSDEPQYSSVTYTDFLNYINTIVTSAKWKEQYDASWSGVEIKDSEGNKVEYGADIDLDEQYTIDYSKIQPISLSELVAQGYVSSPLGMYIANMCNAEDATYETLKIKSCDCGTAMLDQYFTSAMVHLTKIKNLDLGEVMVDELIGRYKGECINPDGTFVYTPGSSTDYGANNSVTNIVLPLIKNSTIINGVEHRHVPTNICSAFVGLNSMNGSEFVGETYVTMSANATCIEKQAFTMLTLSNVTFNSGLKMIGNNAFDYFHGTQLVFPASIEYIGKEAFGQGYLHDVYFTGKNAPIVEMDAFGSKAYVNNDAYTRPQNSTIFDSNDLRKTSNWRVSRASYVNGDYMMAMLHLPKDLTLSERAAYTDNTRDFHVFEFKRKIDENGKASSSGVLTTLEKSSTLKSTKSLLIKDEESGNEKVYWNGIEGDNTTITSKGGFNVSTYNTFELLLQDSDNDWINASSHYDLYVGEQYVWPNQAAYCRSYAVATNNLLWDGTSTIGSGISESYTSRTYDINCDGDTDDEGETAWVDGSEYIGLHQFVLVTNDLGETTTEEWGFDFEGANWWTLCVPVDMTVAEVRKAFGEETQVCKFNKVSRAAKDKVKFFFTDEQCYGKTDESAIAVEANYPYMIRPSKAKDATYTFTLPNYTLSPSQIPTPVPITVTDKDNGKSYTYTYIGQYNTASDGGKLCMPQYSYYLGAVKGNETYHKLFIQTGEKGKWKPFTCVILASDGADDYATFFDPNRNQNQNTPAKGMVSAFGLDVYGEDNATSISDYEVVCGAENSEPVYNLNGQVVNPNHLRKGIYIKKGSKFIVK